MKLVTIACATLFGLSAQAAPVLKSLSCKLSNGVSIKTLEATDDGVLVMSYLGLYTKEFTAVLADDVSAGNAIIDLQDSNGKDAYHLYLPIDRTLSTRQAVKGTIGKPNLWTPLTIDFVADADCKVRLAP